MQITRTARPLESNIRIWQCEGCGVVHLKIRDSLVDLSKDEFATFTEKVVDLWCKGEVKKIADGTLIC